MSSPPLVRREDERTAGPRAREEHEMTTHADDATSAPALPPIVDQAEWEAELATLRAREKAATPELDAIAAARRRLPMVELPDYVLEGADGPIRLVDVFAGAPQLVVYHHMWEDGAEWQCDGCTGLSSQWGPMQHLEGHDARMVVVTQGRIDE